MTATERVLPRLALDFTTGVLDPRVTVTRALNTATRINGSGFIESVNADLPRFDYDPVTLAPKGLLIEEARTNFVLQSNAPVAQTGVSLTAAAATSPDGTTNAYKFEKTDATTPRYIRDFTSMTVAANTTYTVSRFVKYDGSNTTVSLEYNVVANWGGVGWVAVFSVASTGVTVSSQTSCTAAVQNFGNGWYRITATFTSGATITTPTNPSFFTRITGASGVAVLGYGAQLETGAFATSYIPTTTTSLTRNADQVTMTGTNFSSWFNASEGTFVATTSVLNLAANRPIMQTSTGGLSNGSQYVYYNPASSRFAYRVYDAGGAAVGAVNYTNAGTPAVNTTYCVAIGYKTDSFAISANGAAVGLDTTGTVTGTADTLLIGSDTAITYLNGHAKALDFYPLRLLNAETQAFSKG